VSVVTAKFITNIMYIPQKCPWSLHLCFHTTAVWHIQWREIRGSTVGSSNGKH